MTVFRKNFGAVAIGPDVNKKILVFGNGSGAKSMYDDTNQSVISYNQVPSHTHYERRFPSNDSIFELYTPLKNSWEKLQAPEYTPQLNRLMQSKFSFVTMLNLDSKDELIGNAQRNGATAQGQNQR